MAVTITEALASLKTITSRISTKEKFILAHLVRPEKLKDPLGNSAAEVASARQSIADLEKQYLNLRIAIAAANASTMVKAGGQTRSIAEWLIWRRSIAPVINARHTRMLGRIETTRGQASRMGGTLIQPGEAGKPEDIVVSLDESSLAASVEQMDTILGELDGQLSLKNATVTIDLGET